MVKMADRVTVERRYIIRATAPNAAYYSGWNYFHELK
jgi:hypothetical protein